MMEDNPLTTRKSVDRKPVQILDANQMKVKALGWLDDNGICQFPPDVVAVANGWKFPGCQYPERLSPAQLQEAIDKDWIQFQDGSDAYHTFAEYVAAFPGYPDPVWMLTQQGRWPPKGIHHIP